MENIAGRKRTGFLIKRGKVYHAVWTLNGKKFMRSTRKTVRREAENELRRIMAPFSFADETAALENLTARIQGRKTEQAQIEAEMNPALAVSDSWSAYLESAGRPDSGPGTLKMYKGQFLAFSSWLLKTYPAVEALRGVTPEIAGAYASHLIRKQGLSANSFNKHIRLLELVFRVLKEPARLERNPWEGIQRKRYTSQSRRELSVDELRKVCDAGTGELRLLFAIGVYTGLRLGDAATLRWSEVDLKRKLIRRIPNKTARRNARPVVIPIHSSLGGMLDEIPEVERVEYVMPEMAGLYTKDSAELSGLIQKHFESCGVRTFKPGTGTELKADENGKVRRVHTGTRAVVEVGFHSLRHTFVSLCRESNAPLAVVEAIVGHSNPAMTRHYTHVSELAAAHAVNGLPSLIGEDAGSPALPAGGKRALKAAGDEESGRLAGLFEAVLAGLEGLTADSLDRDRAKVSELVRQAQALAGAA